MAQSSSHADWSGRDSRIDHAACRYMRRLTRFTVGGPVPSGGTGDRVRDRLADVLGDLVERDLDRLAGRAVGELGDAVGQAALADRHPERDADELGVAALDAGPDLAVVDDHVDA